MKRAVVLLVALSAVMFACGDDDDGDAGGVSTEAGGAAASTPAGGSTAAGGDEYCTALDAYKTSRDEFAAAVEHGATPDEIEAAVTNEGTAFMALVDVAPDDIADDLAAIAGPTDSFLEAFAGVDYDVDQLTMDNAGVAEALNQLDGPDYIEATLSVDAYNLETCDVTIGDWQPAVP